MTTAEWRIWNLACVYGVLHLLALALATGAVERVYWWRMVARGYGLIAPEPDGRLHRRPAWSAMKTLIAELGGALFTETLPSRGGVWLYRFDRDGRTIVVAWSLQTGASAELPAPAVTATSRDGAALPTPDGTSIATGPSPVYYVLEM